VENQPSRPLTVERVGSIVTEACNNLFDRLQNARDQQPQQQQQQQLGVRRVRVPMQLYPTPHGKFSRLPPGFRVPNATLKSAWEFYCCGDEAKEIPPLRSVNGFEMDRKRCSLFTRYRKLMDAIYRKAVEQNIWQEPPANRIVANEILNAIDLSEIIPFHVRDHRPGKRLVELSWLRYRMIFITLVGC